MEGSISFCSPSKCPCQGCPASLRSSEVEHEGEGSQGWRLARLPEPAGLCSHSQWAGCHTEPHPIPTPPSPSTPPSCLPHPHPRKRCHSHADLSTRVPRPAGRTPGGDRCVRFTGPCPPSLSLPWQQPLWLPERAEGSVASPDLLQVWYALLRLSPSCGLMRLKSEKTWNWHGVWVSQNPPPASFLREHRSCLSPLKHFFKLIKVIHVHSLKSEKEPLRLIF